jgi:hypothetical protein
MPSTTPSSPAAHPEFRSTLDDSSCSDLLKELIERMVHTNGLEFCARGDIYLAKCMLDDKFREIRKLQGKA